jgi:hypothetical protein
VWDQRSQRRALLTRHRSLLEPLAELPPVDQSPASIASAKVAAVIGELEALWLSRELEHQPIRSWQIEGFGEGLQARLRTHLHGVMAGLRTSLRGHIWPLQLAVQALQRDLDALEKALADLQQGIANQLKERDRLLEAFAALF